MPKHARHGRSRHRRRVRLAVPLLVALVAVAPAVTVGGDHPTGRAPGVAPVAPEPPVVAGGAPAGGAEVPRRPSVAGPSGAPAAPDHACAVGPKLVPTCNILWGAAAGGFGPVPRDEAIRSWEAASGRPTSIYHAYHRGDEVFPTPAEV